MRSTLAVVVAAAVFAAQGAFAAIAADEGA
jgi:hypothetical protein